MKLLECQCDTYGAVDNNCDVETGQCICNLNYAGGNCSDCNTGMFETKDLIPTCMGMFWFQNSISIIT